MPELAQAAAEFLDDRGIEKVTLVGNSMGCAVICEFAHLYPDVMESVEPDQLASLAAAILRPPPMLDLSHVTPIRYTMDEAREAVRTHLGRLGQASFRDLVADCDERIQIVVRFLALLDLYREGEVDLAQAETFGEIHVRWEGPAR